ncbi:hypothetical protein HDU76_003780 [Blyttiomyces sp. JEL0837]|nr:hypothetical protein HDU76_003780 [Blyttiomyces sp. JEL0837]
MYKVHQQAEITPQQSHRLSFAAASFVTSSPFSPLPADYWDKHRPKNQPPPPTVVDTTSDKAEDAIVPSETNLKRKRECENEDWCFDSPQTQNDVTEDEDDDRHHVKRSRTISPGKSGSADDEDDYFDEEVDDEEESVEGEEEVDDYFKEEEAEGSVEGDDEEVVEEVEEGGEEGKVALMEEQKLDDALAKAGDNFFEGLEREAVSGGVAIDMDMKDVMEKEPDATVEREKEMEGGDDVKEIEYKQNGEQMEDVKEGETIALEKEGERLKGVELNNFEKKMEGERIAVEKEVGGLEDTEENGEKMKNMKKIKLVGELEQMDGDENTKVEDITHFVKTAEGARVEKEGVGSEADEDDIAKIVGLKKIARIDSKKEEREILALEIAKLCHDRQLKALENVTEMTVGFCKEALGTIKAIQFPEKGSIG